MDLKPIIKSSKFFFSLIFKKIEVDIIFIYLSHFNRVNGENNYLSHLISDVKKNNKSYIVFEDTDLGGAYREIPRSKSAVPFDFITLVYVSLLKLGFSEHTVFSIINKCLLRNLSFKKIINMAGYTNRLFLSQYPECEMYEVQHGMLFNGREWWMQELWNKYPNCGLLLFGKGYKNMISTRSDIYSCKENDKAKILGFENTLLAKPSINSDILLLTEQITIDNSDKEIADYLQHLELIFDKSDILEKFGLKLLTKTHPRSPIKKIKALDSLNMTRADLIHKDSKIFLHATFNSSSIFEFGLSGVPTILLSGLMRRDPSFFLDEYNFPFTNLIIQDSKDLESAIHYLRNYKNYSYVSKAIKDWSVNFYSSLETNLI